MAPFILMLISLLVFRGFGALGLSLFASWQDSTRYALALMFLFTATTHFTGMKEDLVKMVPSIMPYPRQLVFFTGLCEILGAIGLVIAPVQRLAGIALILLLVALFPANINAARNAIPLRGKPPTPLWLRLPLQMVWIGLLCWSTQ